MTSPMKGRSAESFPYQCEIKLGTTLAKDRFKCSFKAARNFGYYSEQDKWHKPQILVCRWHGLAWQRIHQSNILGIEVAEYSFYGFDYSQSRELKQFLFQEMFGNKAKTIGSKTIPKLKLEVAAFYEIQMLLHGEKIIVDALDRYYKNVFSLTSSKARKEALQNIRDIWSEQGHPHDPSPRWWNNDHGMWATAEMRRYQNKQKDLHRGLY